MCGCTSCAAASASRRNRSAHLASRARCACSTLIDDARARAATARRGTRSPCRRRRAAAGCDSGCPSARRSARDLLVGLLERRARELGQRRRCTALHDAGERAIPGSALGTEHAQPPNCMWTKSYGGQGPVHSSCISRSRFCSSRTMSLNASHRSRSMRNDARAAGPASPAWLLITSDATAWRRRTRKLSSAALSSEIGVDGHRRRVLRLVAVRHGHARHGAIGHERDGFDEREVVQLQPAHQRSHVHERWSRMAPARSSAARTRLRRRAGIRRCAAATAPERRRANRTPSAPRSRNDNDGRAAHRRRGADRRRAR